MSYLVEDLPDLLPNGRMRVKSYLPKKRIYLSRTTGGHLFRALDMQGKEWPVTGWILPFV